MQNTFMDLVTTSSLRYLRKVCEIYNLNDKDIDLDYDISQWA